MRGRKLKSPEQKYLSGYPSHSGSRTNGSAIVAPPAEFEDVPVELAGIPLAESEWHRLAPILRRQRQIVESDRSALIAACLEWAKYITAVKSLAVDGAVLRGRLRLNPQTAIAQKSLAALSRLWPELGCTPASRSRIPLAALPAEDDPFAEFDEPPDLRPVLRRARDEDHEDN